MSVRVLVVDDSAFARKVVREVLSRAGFEVVGTAADGLEALEKIQSLSPDVVTLDLVMPNLDGLGVLAALQPGGPRVVVVSMAGEDMALGIAALQAGAVDLVQKPTAQALEKLYDVSEKLVPAVRAAAEARPLPAGPVTRIPAAPIVPRRELVVMGASTGGPQALTRLLRALPESFPSPIAIVLHLPPGYTQAFAERLDRECALEILEADEGLPLLAGRAVIARGGVHLRVRRRGAELVCALDREPAASLHRPAVDVLFSSAAAACGGKVLGVVLTGMGDDGTRGARDIHAAGGLLLTESERSCVVYGMPRCVVEAGLSAASAGIDQMASELLRRL